MSNDAQSLSIGQKALETSELKRDREPNLDERKILIFGQEKTEPNFLIRDFYTPRAAAM